MPAATVTGWARRSRRASLIVAGAGLLASVTATTPASAASYCYPYFYWNNDGSQTWQSAQVGPASGGAKAYLCNTTASVSRSAGATQLALPGVAFPGAPVVDLWWNNDGVSGWSNDGFGTYPANLQGAAVTAGGTEVAYVGTDGSVGFGYNPNPSGNPSGWTLEQVAPGGSATGQPAITNSALGTEITATSIDGSLWFYWAVNGSTTWHRQQIAGNGTTAGSPALTDVSGVTEIATISPAGAVWFYWITDGTQTWHPAQVSGSATAYAGTSPAIAATSSFSDIAYTGQNGSLGFYWVVNGTSTWTQEQVAGPGSVSTSTSPVLVFAPNATEIAATAPDGSLWFYWATNGTTTWHRGQVAGADQAAATATPAIARFSGGTEITVLR